jgi:hypothetical protein
VKITDLMPGRPVYRLGVIVLTDGTQLTTGAEVTGPLITGDLTGRVVLDGGWLYAEVDERGEGERRIDVWPASQVAVIQNVHPDH